MLLSCFWINLSKFAQYAEWIYSMDKRLIKFKDKEIIGIIITRLLLFDYDSFKGINITFRTGIIDFGIKKISIIS